MPFLRRLKPQKKLTAIRIPAYAFAKNSSESMIAAKLPLTIFGDMGELASNKLDPKASFFSRVSLNL